MHDIPKVSFQNTYTSNFSIKHQPESYCLSTIETIYHLIEEFNEFNIESTQNHHQQLVQILERMIHIQKKCANDPDRATYKRGSFKKPEDRIISKNKNKRLIYFDPKNYK